MAKKNQVQNDTGPASQQKPQKKKRLSKTAPNPINIETVQASVPIYAVHEQYDLIETQEGCFVKSYLLGDNNYLTAPEEEQRMSFLGWRKVINSFGTNMEFALTIVEELGYNASQIYKELQGK